MKQELKLQIEVKDIEAVKTFIDTVAKYFYDLPKELQDILKYFSEKGLCGMNADHFQTRFGKFEKFETSLLSDKILRLDESLKSVTYVEYDDNDELKEITVYPKHFWIKLDGKIVIQWDINELNP